MTHPKTIVTANKVAIGKALIGVHLKKRGQKGENSPAVAERSGGYPNSARSAV
jgi:hypothetical protein